MAITIEVRNNNVEKGSKSSKKKLNKDGQMKELKQRQYYQKPSEIKREKKKEILEDSKKSKR